MRNNFWRVLLPFSETPGGFGGGGGQGGWGQPGGFESDPNSGAGGVTDRGQRQDWGSGDGRFGTPDARQQPQQGQQHQGQQGQQRNDTIFGRQQGGQTRGQQQGQFQRGQHQQQPINLTDDTLVMVNGRPVRWADHRAATYMERGQYDRDAATLREQAAGLDRGRKALFDYAQQLEQAFRQQQRPQQPTRDDLLNNMRGMAAADGQSVAELVQHMYDSGLAPIGQQIAGLVQRLTRAEQQIQQYQQQQGPIQERHQEQLFDNHINGHLGKFSQVEIPGISWRVDMNDPASGVLRETAKDLWLSHNQQEWTPEEFQRQLQARIGGMIQFVRAGDKAYTAHLNDQKQRRFVDFARGGGQPSGQQPYVFKTGAELARMVFGNQDANAT